jgi:hypothetical protein
MGKCILFFLMGLLTLASCQHTEKELLFEKEAVQHFCVQQLTNVIVHDIISPPVASRMYAYTNLAFYEALKTGFKDASSITDRCKGFSPMPGFDEKKEHDFGLGAATAFFKVAEALVFSKDSMRTAMTYMQAHYKNLDATVFRQSITYGEEVAKVILERAAKDNYKETRGMPRYSVFREAGKWEQTPPDYADAAEPYWKLIKPLRLDSASQCRPPRPPVFSKDPSSKYYKEVMELFELSKNLSPEQETIAIYWDDNPFVTEHRGHLTFANKKTTPVGHWMGITGILCKQYASEDLLKTAKAYALTSSAIFDGFISCWDEKYNSRTVRPITVIREWFDPVWESKLQTPPFPEYTSGHSVISAAAAMVLDAMFGDKPFLDTTELPYLGLQRNFTSVKAAAEEVSISRLYGGIHYRSALDEGLKQGESVGAFFVGLIP